jgi:flavin-dependent dehydrogenase
MARTSGAFTVVVAGGGPAGIAVALALKAANLEVLVIERSAYCTSRVGEHITPDGRGALCELWAGHLADGAGHMKCFGVRSAWGSPALDRTDYFFHPFSFGLNLSRPQFDAHLANLARQQGISVETRSKCVDARRTVDGWQIEVVSDGRRHRVVADFIVDASGRSASFARSQGSRLIALDNQIAIVGFLRAFRGAAVQGEETILIEASDTGWWYSAPLNNARCVCMFVTDADLLESGKDPVQSTWRLRLAQTRYMRSLVDAFPLVERMVVCSARTQRLNKVAGRGWLAVGDAAMAFDPLSSQGISKGLRHARRAADVVMAYLNGDAAALDRLGHEADEEFMQYLVTRTAYYQVEQRWPTSPFWQRRHEFLRTPPAPTDDLLKSLLKRHVSIYLTSVPISDSSKQEFCRETSG